MDFEKAIPEKQMYIRSLSSCPEFIAGDGSVLRELMNAATEKVPFRYSLAHAVVKAGKSTAPHILKTSEVYYILSGKGIMHIDSKSAEVVPGDAVSIPPGSVQYIENKGNVDLAFLCIVDPAWRREDEIILP